MATFIPETIAVQAKPVPFFEDSMMQEIPGRGTEKKVTTLQGEVVDLMARLGGSSVQFVPGIYEEGRKRYGFQILFWMGSAQGRMDCAALPLKTETVHKKDRALAQALYLLRDELRAMVHASIYKPGSVPLVPYLLGPGGKTVTEFLIETQNLPLLMART